MTKNIGLHNIYLATSLSLQYPDEGIEEGDMLIIENNFMKKVSTDKTILQRA